MAVETILVLVLLLLLVMICGCLLMWYLVARRREHFGDGGERDVEDARKDRRTMDLVVARYAEDLDWMSLPEINLAEFDRVIVYNKGSSPAILPDRAPDQTPVVEVRLPNVGRCDHTYIHHIVTMYDDLADVTVFLPASCTMTHKWSQTQETLRIASETRQSVFIGKTMYPSIEEAMGTFELSEWGSSHGANANANPDNSMLPSPERPFKAWYEANDFDKDVDFATFLGIFAVSREDVHHRALESYQHLMGYLDTHNNPEAGHYFERAWLAIFAPTSPASRIPVT